MAIDICKLGKLSAKYESNGDPGCVSSGRGDYGGISYGMYQLSTKTGSIHTFIWWLLNKHKQYHDRLKQATPGTDEFAAIWQAIAKEDREGFAELQHAFIADKFYHRARRHNAAAMPELDIYQRSTALNDVLWSTSVQHGVSGCSTVINNALAGKDIRNMSDENIIKAIYAERGRTDDEGNLVYFKRSSKSVQKSVKHRFHKELQTALQQLQYERT